VTRKKVFKVPGGRVESVKDRGERVGEKKT